MSNNAAGHGGDIFAAARDLGLSWREVLDYSANINPLGPPPGLKKHLFDSFDLTANYPDPHALGWRRELAALHGLSVDELVAGNGTTQLMYALVRAINPKKPVVFVPAFSEYEAALACAGLEAGHVQSSANDDFDLTPSAAGRLFDSRPDIVFLTNPTSPAGRLLDPGLLDRVLYAAEKTGALVVLDEAFLDFTDASSLAEAVRRRERLIVLRSLTKFYALPGLRLGYLAASADMAKKIADQVEPWSVNSLALTAGTYCLSQQDYAERTRQTVDRERNWLFRRLTRMGLGRVTPGTANYLLVKLEAEGFTEEGMVAALKSKGILVRGCASFQGVLKGYLRLAVKTRPLNQRLVKALEEVLAQGPLE